MSRDDTTAHDVEDYWLPLLKTDGQWDETKIRAELHDLVFVLHQVSELYDHVSGGKLSKPMYFADVIKAEFDDAVSKAGEEDAARVRELEAALGFYADERNYDEETGAAGKFRRLPNTVHDPGEVVFEPDGGDVARAAL